MIFQYTSCNFVLIKNIQLGQVIFIISLNIIVLDKSPKLRLRRFKNNFINILALTNLYIKKLEKLS